MFVTQWRVFVSPSKWPVAPLEEMLRAVFAGCPVRPSAAVPSRVGTIGGCLPPVFAFPAPSSGAFRRTASRLAVSPYVLFLKKTKDLFPGKRAVERGKLVSALYHALPAAEKEKLLAEARSVSYSRKYKSKKAPKPERPRKAATPYNLFFRANVKAVAHIENRRERMAELGRRWAEHKERHGNAPPAGAVKADKPRPAAATAVKTAEGPSVEPKTPSEAAPPTSPAASS